MSAVNVAFRDHKPSVLTTAILKVALDVEEIRERYADFQESNTIQDLGHIATTLKSIERDIDLITDMLARQAQERRLRWVGDESGIIALPDRATADP